MKGPLIFSACLCLIYHTTSVAIPASSKDIQTKSKTSTNAADINRAKRQVDLDDGGYYGQYQHNPDDMDGSYLLQNFLGGMDNSDPEDEYPGQNSFDRYNYGVVDSDMPYKYQDRDEDLEDIDMDELNEIFKSLSDENSQREKTVTGEHSNDKQTTKNDKDTKGDIDLKNLSEEQIKYLLAQLKQISAKSKTKETDAKEKRGDTNVEEVSKKELQTMFGSTKADDENDESKRESEGNSKNEQAYSTPDLSAMKTKRSGGLVRRKKITEDSGTGAIPADIRQTPKKEDESESDEPDYKTLFELAALESEYLQRETEYLTNALDIATAGQLAKTNRFVPLESAELQKAIEVENTMNEVENELFPGREEDEDEDGYGYSDDTDEELVNKRNDDEDIGYFRSFEDKRGGDMNEIGYRRLDDDDDDGDDNDEDEDMDDGIYYDAENDPRKLRQYLIGSDKMKEPELAECDVVQEAATGCSVMQDIGIELETGAADLCDRHFVCYMCGKTLGTDAVNCDNGYLQESKRMCGGDVRCKQGAEELLLIMQYKHQFIPFKTDICKKQCVYDFVVGSKRR